MAVKGSLWLTIGFLSVALGAIGVILPVLPTTPFIILAAFSFGKSSPRLQAWLENDKRFGPIIADWREKGAIKPRYKLIAMTMMAAAFTLSILMQVSPIVLIIQAVCMIGAAMFILTRPS